MNARTLNEPAPQTFVDRASNRLDTMLDATRVGAESAIDRVADRMHSVRDRASPAMARMSVPIDRLSARTQDAPLKSLLVAAATGAVLMAVLGLLRPGR
ncbi:MAG TPA: hypothetical protein VGM74_08855 [Burkholderiaceae bacterium]|jgi:hypothetical protein